MDDVLYEQIRNAGLPMPDLDYWFGAHRHENRWMVDACWPDLRIAVDIEPTDAAKATFLKQAGWLYVRVTQAMVDDGSAIQAIRDALAARGQDVRYPV